MKTAGGGFLCCSIPCILLTGSLLGFRAVMMTSKRPYVYERVKRTKSLCIQGPWEPWAQCIPGFAMYGLCDTREAIEYVSWPLFAYQ